MIYNAIFFTDDTPLWKGKMQTLPPKNQQSNTHWQRSSGKKTSQQSNCEMKQTIKTYQFSELKGNLVMMFKFILHIVFHTETFSCAFLRSFLVSWSHETSPDKFPLFYIKMKTYLPKWNTAHTWAMPLLLVTIQINSKWRHRPQNCWG